MGKVSGFIEYCRQNIQDRNPLERINDYNEFHINFSDELIEQQAARCMDCGTPYCHIGMIINGMASGCPLNNLIPEWNDLIYRGLWEQALDRLLMTNNFPEFTGRVCPAPCEGSCTLGLDFDAGTIKSNECSIIDKAFNNGWMLPSPPSKRTGEKVAVIGSGPSGLACAYQLNKMGHHITVYERDDRIGGILVYGIPNMKLDKSIVQRRIELMEAEGITFITNKELGVNLPFDSLLEEYASVILCIGSTIPRDLNVEGRNLEGIHFAMNFLKSNTKSLLDSNHADGKYISAKDKNVIIIGGGDTGTDCVATSIRHKCKSLNQFEILPPPPTSRLSGNPWPQWPKVLKSDYGHEEAIAIFGRDPRTYSIMTKKFIGNNENHVQEVVTINVDWKCDSSGKYIPVEIPGTEKVWPADLVLICMGFAGPDEHLLSDIAIKFNLYKDNVYKTNIDKVFACGDARRGQSLVVWAIHEGRNAAIECDRYLCSRG